MEFPTIVYRVPGKYKAPGGKGKTYDYHGAADKAEYDKLISQGWFETIGHAQANIQTEIVKDNSPTRAEMEQKAEELSIKVDGRWSDKRLLAEIEKAL